MILFWEDTQRCCFLTQSQVNTSFSASQLPLRTSQMHCVACFLDALYVSVTAQYVLDASDAEYLKCKYAVHTQTTEQLVLMKLLSYSSHLFIRA